MSKKSKIIIMVLVITITIIYTIYQNKTTINETKINIENITENNMENKEETSKVIVHISGAVCNQGIYEANTNDRISDIIEKAGGLLENSDITDINLALKVEDEMKIYIPKKDEKNEKHRENTIKEELENETKETNSIIKVKVNINTANQKELETLPGIGSSTALKIIEYRKEKGNFKKIEDIKNVKGIGESKFTKIKDLIKV